MELEIFKQILAKLEALEQKQGAMQSDIDEIKKRVIIIENEHGQKLDALFKGYSLRYDLAGDLRKDIAALKAVQEKHDLQIKWLLAEKAVS